jgi:hypothetical protein
VGGFSSFSPRLFFPFLPLKHMVQAQEARDAGAQQYFSTATALLESRRIALATMSTPVRGAGDTAARYEMDVDVDGARARATCLGAPRAARASGQLWHSQRRTQADLLAPHEVWVVGGGGFFFLPSFFQAPHA